MENTKYKVLLVPSTEDEKEYENLETFDEALELSEIREGDSSSVFTFESEKEREAFLQGVAAMEGYCGNGLAFTKNI